MKISDIIFHFRNPNQRGNDGIFRVRVFVSRTDNIIALVTDLGSMSTGPSVTNYVEHIRTELISSGAIGTEAKIVEHYEKSNFQTATYDYVTFSDRGSPNWEKMTAEETAQMLECHPEELEHQTLNDPRLLGEIRRVRNTLDPFMGSPYPEDPKIIKRRLEIISGQVKKSHILALVSARSNEQDIQRLIKRDLSIIAEVYASPQDEYICFSEFPIGDGYVDFAIFSNRSRMDVTLVEVKGADFNLVNQDSYGNFSQKFNESVNQIRTRLGIIYEDGLSKFQRTTHSIRERVEAGEKLYNSFVGPHSCHHVDPNKGINLRCVVIGGRTVNDLEESRQRHDYERTFVPPIKIETWDSWLMKLRRL